MTPRSALVILLGWPVLFGLTGGCVGSVLGIVAPDYYRTVLLHGRDRELNPVQAGLGLGVTQGCAVGLVVALLVVVLFAWRDLRRANGAAQPVASASATGSWRTLRLVVGAVLGLVAFSGISGVAFVMGGIVGQTQLYESQGRARIQRIEKLVSRDVYPQLESGRTSAGEAYLQGTVRDARELSDLREILAREFGEPEARFMLSGVEAEERSRE